MVFTTLLIAEEVSHIARFFTGRIAPPVSRPMRGSVVGKQHEAQGLVERPAVSLCETRELKLER